MAIDFLCHFNGTNGSTTFVDEAGHTITANGTAQLTTSNAKFGTAAGLFDGTDTCNASVDPTGFSIAANATLDVSVSPTAYNPNWSTIVKIRDTTNIIVIYFSDDGSLYFNGTLAAGAGAVPLNVYTNIRVVKFDSTLRIFKNGVYLTEIFVGTDSRTPTVFQFGGYGSSGDGVIGTIDEVMLDTTVAWNITYDSYTIPTTEFAYTPPVSTTEASITMAAALANEAAITMSALLTAISEASINLSAALASESTLALSAALANEASITLSAGFVSVTEASITLSAGLVSVTEASITMTAPLQPYTVTEASITMSAPLAQDYQSVVIDIHNPENPIYGSY